MKARTASSSEAAYNNEPFDTFTPSPTGIPCAINGDSTTNKEAAHRGLNSGLSDDVASRKFCPKSYNGGVTSGESPLDQGLYPLHFNTSEALEKTPAIFKSLSSVGRGPDTFVYGSSLKPTSLPWNDDPCKTFVITSDKWESERGESLNGETLIVSGGERNFDSDEKNEYLSYVIEKSNGNMSEDGGNLNSENEDSRHRTFEGSDETDLASDRSRQCEESNKDCSDESDFCDKNLQCRNEKTSDDAAVLSFDRTITGKKEQTFARLQDELEKAHQELKLKDEEVTKLTRIREDVERELEDLTEAHKMVGKAKEKQAAAEKSLKESQMKVDVLTAEVIALKTLVLTSTPSRPNPHLHPQIGKEENSGGVHLFNKKHRRSPSHFNLKYGRENSPPESPVRDEQNPVHNTVSSLENRDLSEVDPTVHKEFMNWTLNFKLDKTDPFIDRIYREDINLCLDFSNRELAEEVQKAIETRNIFIEAVTDKTKTIFPRKCALLEVTRQCHYRMKLGDQDTWYNISQMCRNRVSGRLRATGPGRRLQEVFVKIIAVCDFINYLRYIELGLVKSSEKSWSMSDLYDSLEDENDEKKRSCDSLDQFKAEASCCPSKGAYRSKSVHHYPFYLNQKLSKDNITAYPYFSSAYKHASYSRQEKNFLPRIHDKLNAKGQEQPQKIVVDNQILNKQGLQLNNDGSFTRSPRPEEEEEELPFISREYRDLHLLRHKIITPIKKTPSARIKTCNKNLFSFTDNPVDGISMNVLISARKKKGSSEEILISESSQPSSRSKSTKCLSRENLTDSMKERLLSRPSKNNQANTLRNDKSKIVKRESKAQSNKATHSKNDDHQNPSTSNKSPQENTDSITGNEVRMKPRSVERKMPRYRSDFAVSAEKPKLNYLERHKLQNGYNPLHLRLGCLATKKVPTDTSRSNFGDSTVDQLSGVSSRNQSIENFMDEDEEKYYRKLMEMDKNRKRRVARSSRSEGPIDFINLKEMKPSPYKSEKRNPYEPKPNKNSSKNKHVAKSLSLDMPFKPENTNKFTKKSFHLCLGGSSTTWSKAELALKAKTYGYMVNARNIFKLKAQSETTSPQGNSPGRSGKSKSGKICPQPNNSPTIQPTKEKAKKRAPLPESLPKVRQRSFGGPQDFPRRKQSSGGVKLSAGRRESQIHFFLPEVRNLSSAGVRIKAEKLEGLNACFKSPKR